MAVSNQRAFASHKIEQPSLGCYVLVSQVLVNQAIGFELEADSNNYLLVDEPAAGSI